MKTEKIAQLTEQLDDMVSKLGLEKLAVDGPVGESAGIIADPGTAQPAEQETARSEIEPATEGAQSASNNQMLKEEVPGDNTAVAKPSDADNSGAASSTENATTATYTGEKKDTFGSKQQTLDAPTTASPADPNKDPEKYSADDIRGSATFIDQEIEKMSAAGEAAPAAGTPVVEEGDEKKAEVTVGDRIGELLLGKEASAEEKDGAVVESVEQYLGGYAKTASLVGEMTADALDIMSKQAEGMPPEAMGAEGMAPEMGGEMGPEGEGVPAEALAADAGGAEAAGGEEAAALAQAAEMVAQELGVTPEEVLQAAAEELAQGGGGAEAAMGGGMPPEMGGEAMGGGEMPPEEDPALAEEAKMASVNEELAELRTKAAELDELKADQSKQASDEHLQSLVTTAVRSTLADMTEAQKA